MQEEIYNSENILPPSPPTNEEILPSITQINEEIKNKFIPGKFYYVKDQNTREMLQTAWHAITLTENWGFVRQPIETFTFSNDKRLNTIYDKIEELGYLGHSGMSFGFTMREMQEIAVIGEEEYKKKYTN